MLKSGRPKGPGWKLTGTVKSRVTLDSLAIYFGESPVEGQTPAPRTVIATTHLPAEGLTATVSACAKFVCAMQSIPK
jgi:hypothetical protein